MKNTTHTPPPKWMLRFFRWFCHPAYVEDIEGDLHERFALLIEEMGLRKARVRFVIEVLLLFRPGLIRSINLFPELINPGMLKHNLLITYRGFLKDKSTFLINLIGLSTGLACVLLIYGWVTDEMSVDKFHEKDSQLYQVMTNFHGPDAIETWEITPVLLGETFMEMFPEVESATLTSDRYLPKGKISINDQSLEANRLFADKRFFEVFSYELLEGDRKQVLADKNNIAISRKLANKLFESTENIIGKTVEWSNVYVKQNFQIAGIFEDPSPHSTLQFDAVFNYDVVLAVSDRWQLAWSTNAVKTHLVLNEGTDIDEFNDKIEFFMWAKNPKRKTNRLFVQKYSEKYLNGRYESGVPTGGRITYIKLFSMIALFILLIACINFMNLSTAQASRKMKEIGVKKTMGAGRRALVWQFLSESILMTLLSCFVAAGLVILFLPQFNMITGKEMQWHMDSNAMLSIALIVTVTGLIAGSYPALYLSGFKPAAVLKGKLNSSRGEHGIRKSLVIFQFALSVIFIAGVLVVDRQMQFIQSKNPGYSRDNVIAFERPINNDDMDVFLDELQRLPGVSNASNMVGDILTGWDDQGGYSWSGQASDEKWIFQAPKISYDVLETLGMGMQEGRPFSKELQDDESKIILNEAAVKLMKLEDPIGAIIEHNKEPREIIGVVGDFNYGSLHHEVKPLIFRLSHWGRDILVKIKSGDEQNTIAQIEQFYHKFHPDQSFNFSFLDEDNQRLYTAETRVATLSKYFAFLAILISCLGLLGLTAFTAERRSKEIGIRKILGSSVWGIIRLLSTDFTKMIVIGILIALPISYMITKSWLNNFAFKIDLEWWYFAGTAILTLLIAWSVIGLQTLKTARLNPIECLRDE